MEDTDCTSESAASSIGDEQRVRRLFQACDANGDGYIDSQDLLAVCQELSLEDSLDELMQQLGADSQGRISYEQFFNRKLALRTEIDALKVTSKGSKDNISDNSQGKVDSWEWDSGARDMSPVSKTIGKTVYSMNEEYYLEKTRIQLYEQAQKYEEQLTELHSVIAELTRKLHEQRTKSITEEDEISESCASAHDESITCPLDVSELDPLDNDISDSENKDSVTESPLELPEPKLIPSNQANSDLSPCSEPVGPLKQEIASLKQQLHDVQSKLTQITNGRVEASTFGDEDTVTNDKRVSKNSNLKNFSNSPGSDTNVDCHVKFSNIIPIHKAKTVNTDGFNFPITKLAERIKLKRNTTREVNSKDLLDTELSTSIAEQIVGDILQQCDTYSEKKYLDFEIQKVNAKLEHARSQNTVLAATLNETKAHCDRLALLCGKYESNAIALRLALGFSDRTIEAYDVLLALLETEVSLSEEDPTSIRNRTAAETVAHQLLSHLDTHQNSDVMLSPWQNHVYNTSVELNEPWTTEHELRLRKHVSRLKAERSKIQGTYVSLESTQVENAVVRPSSSQDAKKMDLEMAILIQEMMGLREDKLELLSKLFILEKNKNALEIKLKYIEGQQMAQSVTLRNLREQLKDTESLLASAKQNKKREYYCDAEHAQGMELELVQALAREAILVERIQKLVGTLEQATENAEARHLEGGEIVQGSNHSNSVLADTQYRNDEKYQIKGKKMDHPRRGTHYTS